MEFVVSAPGKVILHGEHSVVYGKVVFILSKIYLFLIRKFRDVIQSGFIDLEHCSFLHINLSSAITMSPVLENEFISYLSVYICISMLIDFHFQKAIASSLSLRTTVKIRALEENIISLDFSDLNIKESIGSTDLTILESQVSG